VILDLTIKGGMGGQETIKQAQGIDPSVKAIVSSGYADNP
jgi:DNA-binding NtrC family response regulator